MMTVVVAGDALRISWQQEPRWRHDDYCAALREISGVRYDPNIRSWVCPLRNADRILEAFPHASYDYDAICAVVDAQKRRIAVFGQNLLDMGVKLVVVDGRVIAQGDGVSPLVQSLIDERCDDLRVWLQSQNACNGAWRRQIGAIDGAVVSSIENALTSDSRPSNEDLRQAGLLASAMRNAAKNQEQEDAMRQQRRRGKKQHA